MSVVKRYKVVIEITVEEVQADQTQITSQQQLKDYVTSLDESTKINDILKSEVWNSFYQSLHPQVKGVLKGALWGLTRNGYDTIAEVKTLNLPLLWTFRNYGEKRINFISQIFDIR